MQTTIQHLDNSEVEITGELPFESLEKHKKGALAFLGKDVSIDGFRKGHIPEEVLQKHVGEMPILHEMAQRALQEAYPNIIQEHNIDPIGQPAISITKLAPQNPLGFTIKTAVMPTIELPDYVKIAQKHPEEKEVVVVSEKEVEDAIENIRKTLTAQQKQQTEQGEKKTTENTDAEKDETLIEITDELVQTLGDFKNVEDFNVKIKEGLRKEKEQKRKESRRMAILEDIMKETNVTLPEILIQSELDRMMAQFEADVRGAGLNIDTYFEQVKKNRDDMQKEWRPDAEKRALSQIVLNAIAEKESITPDKKRVEEQTELLMQQYPQANKQQAQMYIASALMNEAVMEFLETTK